MNENSTYTIHEVINLLELLRTSVQQYGAHTAFRRTKEDITYFQFETDVLRIANSLKKISNKYILIDVKDPILFAISYFAVVITGNIAVLADSQHHLGKIDSSSIDILLTDNDILQRLSSLPISYDEVPNSSVERVCTIIYSSGTVSSSKGIMLSQENLCCDLVSALKAYPFTSNDRLVHLIPYSHIFGLVGDMLAPLLSGSTICIPDSKEKALSQLSFFRPTMINSPPAIAEAVLSMIILSGNETTITGGCLRKILCGGAGLRADITEAFLQWNIKALGCYGMTECSACVSINHEDFFKPGSAGLPISCNSVRIADDGEILVKGKNVMLGYYADLLETESVIIDGEYHTGDLGYIDKDGFLYITGRKSNLIVFDDGTKCLPEYLENQIQEHPAVQEVLVYSKRMNGKLNLCVSVYTSEKEMIEDIKQYILCIPTYQPFSQIIFTQEPLPKTKSGKVRRTL